MSASQGGRISISSIAIIWFSTCTKYAITLMKPTIKSEAIYVMHSPPKSSSPNPSQSYTDAHAHITRPRYYNPAADPPTSWWCLKQFNRNWRSLSSWHGSWKRGASSLGNMRLGRSRMMDGRMDRRMKGRTNWWIEGKKEAFASLHTPMNAGRHSNTHINIHAIINRCAHRAINS